MNDFLEDVKKQSRASKLEDSFFAELKIYGLPTPERQFRFHPVRRWAFDFAWPDCKIAVEIHGGIYMNKNSGKTGGHNRGAYMEQSFEKENEAQRLGWKVFLFGPSQVRGKKRVMRASQACEFLWKLFHPMAGDPNPGANSAR